jgi:hypothetical protein
VIPALDVDTIYRVPLNYHEGGLDDQVLRHFGIEAKPPALDRWREIVARITRPEGEVTIAVVGKYTGLLDAYKSLAVALGHGGIANNVSVRMNWLDAQIFEREDPVAHLDGIDGILVPGGFGERGSDRRIAAVRFADRPDADAASAFVQANGSEAMYKSLALRKECCHIRKMEPLERALAGKKGWLTGLRREQSAARAEVHDIEQQPERAKINPLVEWTQGDIWHYISINAIPYNPLHDQFFPSIGCAP